MDDIRAILDGAIEALSGVCGISAIVLGGSRARGTHKSGSDIDIGIYYDADALDLAALDLAAQSLDDEHRPGLIAPPGGWGRWVNAGGWLAIGGTDVDLILRDAARVAQVIEQCQSGAVAAHYQPGHPHAFIDAMYMGELAVCRMLWDGSGAMSALKVQAESYPPALKAALVGMFSFEAGFSQMLAAKCANTGDVYYVAAHIARSVSALNQLLFALNETYCLNEKRAVSMIDGFPLRPQGYGARVQAIFAALGTDEPSACALLQSLVEESQALAQ